MLGCRVAVDCQPCQGNNKAKFKRNRWSTWKWYTCRLNDCKCVTLSEGSFSFVSTEFVHGKYTNPARGILDFCMQKFFRPLPYSQCTPILCSQWSIQCALPGTIGTNRILLSCAWFSHGYNLFMSRHAWWHHSFTPAADVLARFQRGKLFHSLTDWIWTKCLTLEQNWTNWNLKKAPTLREGPNWLPRNQIKWGVDLGRGHRGGCRRVGRKL